LNVNHLLSSLKLEILVRYLYYISIALAIFKGIKLILDDYVYSNTCTWHVFSHDQQYMYMACIQSRSTIHVYGMHSVTINNTCTWHVFSHDQQYMYIACIQSWSTIHVYGMYSVTINNTCTWHAFSHDQQYMCMACIQ
jgi:exosortase/archaeosortase